MRDLILWNHNDDCRFTVRDKDLFSNVIPTHFTGVGSFNRFEQMLRIHGFKRGKIYMHH